MTGNNLVYLYIAC